MQQLSLCRLLHPFVLPPQTYGQVRIHWVIVAGGSNLEEQFKISTFLFDSCSWKLFGLLHIRKLLLCFSVLILSAHQRPE